MTQRALGAPSSALVADAVVGDPAAVEDLIAVVRPMIIRYCRSRLSHYHGGPELADDVAQETCVALVRVLPRYRDRGAPFASWVYAIASNKVADAQRAVLQRPIQTDEMPDLTEPSPTPEQLVVADARIGEVLALLDELPARTRGVLLYRAHGFSVQETATQLGMSAGAVRVAHHRGAARLRQRLGTPADLQALRMGDGCPALD